MRDISLKSTKKQLMEEVIRLRKTIENTDPTMAQVHEKKIKKTRLESAQSLIDMNIINPEIVKQFDDLKFAIEEAKNKLAAMCEVENVLIEAETVIIARDNLIAAREKEEIKKLEDLKVAIDQLSMQRELKLTRLEEEYIERKEQLEKERKHDIQEFAYELSRKRKLESDAWADEQTLREKAFVAKKVEFEERENKIAAKEAEFAELVAKVEGIDALIKAAKKEAQEAAIVKFDKEKLVEIDSIKKNADWEVKVAFLERTQAVEDLNKANAKIKILEAKLESAYKSMSDLAATTVQSAGAIKVLDVAGNKNEK
ncbi:hypothetical protein [Candidatus Epulonipiscium viviparus]|uniref:hypothetical protein n=1 Tax=Candidatus Epulonipiscium viviparus TaxID=420336 RepID=UPI002738051A|nr:hypothetical protein [Candidatus Epulopiscium viviparus]